MIAAELSFEGKQVVEQCLNRGLLINCTHQKVLRLMPALSVTKKEINQAVSILDEVFSRLNDFKPSGGTQPLNE